MANKEKVLSWLKQHDLITIQRLEVRCNIPQRMLQKAIKELQPLPDKYVPEIVAVLKQYGYR